MSAEQRLLDFYDAHLTRYGDCARGAAWPSEAERDVRFDVFLDVARRLCDTPEFSLCDYACGTGEFLRRIRERAMNGVAYAGIDPSASALGFARAKFPNASFESDGPARCDVLIVNGLFTVRADLSEGEMWSFMTTTIERLWPKVARGIAFNVMSPIVEWRRDDLFHVSYDSLASFLHGLAGRRIGFRADYGLYEYVAYAIKA